MKTYSQIVITIAILFHLTTADAQPQMLLNAVSGKYLNTISIKARRDFKHQYSEVDNERWLKSSEGVITARFEKDGCNTTVYYNKYGSWEATMKNYYEDKLPFLIRDRVKSKYYDFSIECVDEVLTTKSQRIPTYIVHIRFKNKVKFIRVSDDDMEVWQEVEVM